MNEITFDEFQRWLTEGGCSYNEKETRRVFDVMTGPQELRPMESAPRDKHIHLFSDEWGNDALEGFFIPGTIDLWVVLSRSEKLLDSTELLGWLPLPEVKTQEGGR